MNEKNKFLIVMLFSVLLVAGASLLYTNLSGNVSAQQIVMHETPQPTSEPAAAATMPPSELSAEPDNPASEPTLFSAPDVHIYDQAGNAVHLSQFFGKPLVLNFWASWCGPCQSEMPDFNKKYQELGDKVNFVMVNMTDGARETVESASAYIAGNGFEFPVFYDTSSEAAITYEAYSLPTTYFINAEGYLIAQAVGAIDAEILQQGIDMILP